MKQRSTSLLKNPGPAPSQDALAWLAATLVALAAVATALTVVVLTTSALAR